MTIVNQILLLGVLTTLAYSENKVILEQLTENKYSLQTSVANLNIAVSAHFSN